MANIIINGNFERGLEMWDVAPEYYLAGDYPLVRSSHIPGYGSSCHIELGRSLVIKQTLPLSAIATDGGLQFTVGGYAADFYVEITYEGEEKESTHFFGHWEDFPEDGDSPVITWEQLSVPVSSTKILSRVAFSFVTAHNFYLRGVFLEGYVIGTPERKIREIPERVYPLPEPFPRMEHRLIAMERELKRISALLAKQASPDIAQEVTAKLQKRVTANRGPGQADHK
jgi:hypothetical protein